MPLQYTAAQIKERIMESIRTKGPSLPIQIARAVNIQPLFASAFLSELYRESKLLMSSMKVGSSPLYLIPGQEAQLENFIEHLNQREKEAFFLIKKEKILNDEEQSPVIRVALRSIPDFANPVNLRINSEMKLFWKHFLIADDEISSIINKRTLSPKEETPKPIKEKTQILPKEIESPKKEILKPVNEAETPVKQEIINAEAPLEHKTLDNIEKKEKKEKPKEETEFAKIIKAHLHNKDIELIEILLDKKKDFMAKVRNDSSFGKQEYLLVAKDKKKLSETDLSMALQKAQLEKMPAIVLSSGDLDKKAQEHIQVWKNLIKFDKLGN